MTIVNELHKELISLYSQQEKIAQKYDPGFGLHKTKVPEAQQDKIKYNALQRHLNNLQGTLNYYGYSVYGPKHTLIKE